MTDTVTGPTDPAPAGAAEPDPALAGPPGAPHLATGSFNDPYSARLTAFMSEGWGDLADVPAPPAPARGAAGRAAGPAARAAAGPAARGRPGRPGAAPDQRPVLPVPAEQRLRLADRRPDPRRRADPRPRVGGRRHPARAAAVAAGRRRVLPGRGQRRAVGRPARYAGRAARRRSGSPARPWPSCPPAWPRSGRRIVSRGFDPGAEQQAAGADPVLDLELAAVLSELRLVKDAVGDRPAARRDRRHHARVLRRGRADPRAGGPDRAARRGRLRRPRPDRRQRQRLPPHRRLRGARHHAALEPQRRAAAGRGAAPAGRGRRGATPCTPRTSPGPSRSAAGTPACSARSTGTCWPRRRRASPSCGPAPTSRPSTARRPGCWPRAWPTSACCRSARRSRCSRTRACTGGGRCARPGHMMGLDVHDCASAREARYLGGPLAAGPGPDRRAGAVLPGQRRDDPARAARHRDPDRGRRADHARRLRAAVRGAAPPARRGAGVVR